MTEILLPLNMGLGKLFIENYSPITIDRTENFLNGKFIERKVYLTESISNEKFIELKIYRTEKFSNGKFIERKIDRIEN